MKKKILYLIIFIILAIAMALISLALACPIEPIRLYNPKGDVVVDGFSPHQLDSIEKEFANIEIIPEFRDVTLTVLAYYPDLKNTKISFQYSSEMTTMASRPDVGSLLLGKREYRVLINNNPDFEGILLSDVPTKAQIGVIAHELAHILQYESYNTMGIIQLGLMFMDDESKTLFERETDERTIARGFGEYLKDWAQYSMYDSPKATEEYKEFKRRTYMSPEEIENEMERFSFYQDSVIPERVSE